MVIQIIIIQHILSLDADVNIDISLTDFLYVFSLHPSLPILATASGQRHFPIPSGLESSDDTDSETDRDNSVRLWWYGGWKEGEKELDSK